jgi:hypothetical protein
MGGVASAELDSASQSSRVVCGSRDVAYACASRTSPKSVSIRDMKPMVVG